jgi:hypothetical protein
MNTVTMRLTHFIVLILCLFFAGFIGYAGGKVSIQPPSVAATKGQQNAVSAEERLQKLRSEIRRDRLQRSSAAKEFATGFQCLGDGRALHRQGKTESSDGQNPRGVSNYLANFMIIRNANMVSAGYGGMRDEGTGTISLSGLSGTVLKAFLYWHGPTNSTNPNANAEVNFAGNTITGEQIGFSHDNCWGYANSQAYRADVTSLITGNGDFSLSNFVKDGTNININGVSLIVFFDDGDSTNDKDYVIFNGNDSNIDNAYDPLGWDVQLNGINYTSGDASIILHVSDGQVWLDDNLILNGSVLASGPSVFNGNTVPNGPNDRNGGLWDIREFSITSYLTPGVNNLQLTTGTYDDCLSLIAAVVCLPAGSAPAEFGTAMIKGSKFSDRDSNGLWNDGEPGIKNWTIYLYQGESLVTAQKTNPLGQYIFVNLLPGTYTVKEEMKDGWFQTLPDSPYVYDVVIDSNEVETGFDFGNYSPPSHLQGTKFHDINGNGVKDIDEPGLSGWWIYVDGNENFFSDTTDANGNFSFDVPMDVYSIYEESRVGWEQTYPSYSYYYLLIDVPGTVIDTLHFGNVEATGEIHGMKFHDLNGNGVKEEGEAGLANWQINLSFSLSMSDKGGTSNNQNEGGYYYTYTDSFGNYKFTNLGRGYYYLWESQQDGWTQTSPLGGDWYVILDTLGQVVNDVDFGNTRANGEIHGMKFNDLNGNGVKDQNEPGLAGWQIYVGYCGFKNGQSNSGILPHVGGGGIYTDSLGRYSITGLLHGYRYWVLEVQQKGWVQTYPQSGSWCVPLDTPGQVITNIDFGNRVDEPGILLDRECLNFATVAVGKSLTLPLTIRNSGTQDLYVENMYADSGFVVLTKSGFTIPPQSSYMIDVKFTPFREGMFRGALRIANNADGVHAVILTGQGELSATGTGQQIFAGMVTIDGKPAPRYTVVGAFRTNGDLITSTIVWVHPDSIQDTINYALSILEGQAGLVDGDTIIFVTGSRECELLAERLCEPYFTIFRPSFPPLDGYTRHDVQAVHLTTVAQWLQPGLNSVSWNIQPAEFLAPLFFKQLVNSEKLQIVLELVHDVLGRPRFNFYLPALGQYNPLRFIWYKKGYLVKLFHTAEPELFTVAGLPICAANPIPLLRGLNLISYLPQYADSVNHALSSISSILDVAADVVRDDSGRIHFEGYPNGNFKIMQPGKGYFVRVSEPGILTYPNSSGSSTMHPASGERKVNASFFGIPQVMFVYGQNVTIHSVTVPQGTLVKAVDADGVICGEGQFLADGVYALGIYGDDPETIQDEGALPGEQVKIYFNNQQAVQTVEWTGFGETFELGGDIVVLDANVSDLLPKEFAVYQNYPNPFNPSTSIKYALPKSTTVSLRIYDMLGREVRTLVNEEQNAGYHHVVWDGLNDAGVAVATGIYTYRFTAGEYSQTQKMMLLK